MKKEGVKSEQEGKERYERGKEAGDFFGLHMTLVLFQYRAY
jgi:hypothetical protein